MIDSVIPNQWLTVPLENVILRIVGGGTPSKSKLEYYQGEIPWMSVKDMNKHVLQDTVDHISKAAVDNSSTNIIPAGTPIIATRMSLGKIVVANFDSAINQDLKAIFLPTEIHQNHLVYWYRSVARSIEQMGTGTTVKGIRLETLKGLTFTLPPLAEQKVIADKLDTLLAQVENTKARLERIPLILKRFRQSVLAAAVSGRLTEEWRSTDQDIEIADTYSVPSDWAPIKVDELSEFVTSGSRGWAKYYSDKGSLFIRSQDINTDELDVSDPCYVSLPNNIEGQRTKVQENDLLLTITGANVTKCARVKDPIDNAFVSQHVSLIRLKDPSIACFIELVLKAPNAGRYQLLKAAYGGGKPGLNLQNIKNVSLALPESEEMATVIRRVDQLFAHADRIEQQANQALKWINNLTQSILAKAFHGELTEQWRKDNPELISGENSAEALLERIKAERAAKAPAKRTRKKATA